MKPPSEEVLSAAQALRAGAAADDLSMPTVRLGLDAGFGPVRLARPASGQLALLVPTALGRRLDEGLAGEGLAVRVAQYTVSGGRLLPFVEVGCTDTNLESAFLWLISAVLTRLKAGRSPEVAVAETIGEFRDLMRRARLFPIERLVGLAGELHVLSRLLKSRPDAAAAWTGPLKQRHDFSLPGACIEAKSTIQQSRRIRVHGLEQLDPPADGRPLLIVQLTYEHGGAGGSSLLDMIESVRTQCADPSLFDSRMDAMELGHWPMIDCFRRERFLLKAESYYSVNAAFPRLSRDSFISGQPADAISAIEYDIDLSRASNCAVSIEHAEKQIFAEAAP